MLCSSVSIVNLLPREMVGPSPSAFGPQGTRATGCVEFRLRLEILTVHARGTLRFGGTRTMTPQFPRGNDLPQDDLEECSARPARERADGTVFEGILRLRLDSSSGRLRSAHRFGGPRLYASRSSEGRFSFPRTHPVGIADGPEPPRKRGPPVRGPGPQDKESESCRSNLSSS